MTPIPSPLPWVLVTPGPRSGPLQLSNSERSGAVISTLASVWPAHTPHRRHPVSFIWVLLTLYRGTIKHRGAQHPTEEGDMAEPESESRSICVSAQQRCGAFWKRRKVRKVSSDSRLRTAPPGEKVENGTEVSSAVAKMLMWA